MNNASPIVVVSAVFAASITVIFLFGYFSGGPHGFRPFTDEPEFKIPVVELVTAAARTRTDETRAVLSSEFSSKSKPTVRVSRSLRSIHDHFECEIKCYLHVIYVTAFILMLR